MLADSCMEAETSTNVAAISHVGGWGCLLNLLVHCRFLLQ